MNPLPRCLSLIAIGWLSLSLSGCQSTPEQLTIEPVMTPPGHSIPVQLRVRDGRPHNHLLRRLHHEDKAEFATAQQPLATLISGNLAPYWPDSPAAERTVDIEIEEALIEVTRAGLQHHIQYELVLATTVQAPQGELQKTFRGQASGQSPVAPGSSRLERDFNLLAGEVLENLVSDQDIRDWLQAEAAEYTEQAP